MTNVLLSFGAVTVMSKILFDWLKNRPTTGQKVIICSLDRTGTIGTINKTAEDVGDIKESLSSLDHKLSAGVKVAERNTEHYEEFIVSLTTLQNLSGQMLKSIEDNTKEIRRQGDAMIKLTSKM